MAANDYPSLDQLNLSVNSFYPRRNWVPVPTGAGAHMISVEDGVSLSCRFFPCGATNPTILFFYGNGETAADYDDIAPFYNQIGVNFFIADYRGYGASGGSPTYSSMLSDAHKVLEELQAILSAGGYGGPIYVMGRSMGRHPAFELGARTPDMVKGMIIESGRPTLGQFLHGLEPALATRLEASYLDKVRSVQLPVLVIHGEQDSLAPVQQAVDMYHDFVSPNKRLLTIPGAGHNDLLNLGVREYFEAIRGFVAGDSAQ
jgi:pimeloyl-ACP methyl ester carboxylesterase